MTAKPPRDEDPDIIEGVAVEKAAPAARRGRRGPKAGQSGRKSAADAAARGDGTTSDGTTSDGATGAGRQAKAAASQDAAGGTGTGLPLMISGAAILLVVAVAGYQIWQAGRSAAALRAEIAAMEDQLDKSLAGLSQLREETDAARAGRRALADRMDRVEATLPVDPSAQLAALATRLEQHEDAVGTLPQGGGSGLPRTDGESGVAHAAMAAAAAMTVADAGGGDPAPWLPVLRQISQAGLDLGDLGRLEALVLSRPPSSAALLADVAPLVEMMQTDTAGAADGGWWDGVAGGLGDFIRFRRSGEGASSNPNADAEGDPLLRLQRATATGGLRAALEASREVTTPSQGLRAWQAAATRRLELDAALAALSAAALSRLAASGDQG